MNLSFTITLAKYIEPLNAMVSYFGFSNCIVSIIINKSVGTYTTSLSPIFNYIKIISEDAALQCSTNLILIIYLFSNISDDYAAGSQERNSERMSAVISIFYKLLFIFIFFFHIN